MVHSYQIQHLWYLPLDICFSHFFFTNWLLVHIIILWKDTWIWVLRYLLNVSSRWVFCVIFCCFRLIQKIWYDMTSHEKCYDMMWYDLIYDVKGCDIAYHRWTVNWITAAQLTEINNAPPSLQWRRNESDDVSNHQPRLFGHRSKKTSKLRVTDLCAGNSPETGEFPTQMASNAGNVSIWWRHHYGKAGCNTSDMRVTWYGYIRSVKVLNEH